MLRNLLLLGCASSLLVGCGTTFLTKAPSADAETAAAKGYTYPDLTKLNAKKVVLVILENTDPDHAQAKPFLESLVKSGAYLSNYYAVAHPSQPNYVALISGSTQNVDGDSLATLDRPFLGDEEHYVDWKVYAEGYGAPDGGCDLREANKETAYVRKHVPHLSFQYVQENETFCRKHVSNMDDFVSAAKAHKLPSFSLVIPNLKNDAHGTTMDVLFTPHAELLSDADKWLRETFGDLIEDPVFRREVLLVVTFDENDTLWNLYGRDDNNKVFAVLLGDDVRGNHKEPAIYTHYDLLRTIEQIFGIKPMASGDRNARVIAGIWK